MEQVNENTSRVQFENHRFFHDLLGHQDEHLRGIEKAVGVKMATSGNALLITGDEEQRAFAGRVATQLYGLLQNGYPVYPSDVDYAIRILSRDRSANLKDIFLDTVYISAQPPHDHAEEYRTESVHRCDSSL